MADSEEEGYFSLWDSHLNYISSNNLNAQAANVVAILGLHCSRSFFSSLQSVLNILDASLE